MKTHITIIIATMVLCAGIVLGIGRYECVGYGNGHLVRVDRLTGKTWLLEESSGKQWWLPVNELSWDYFPKAAADSGHEQTK